MRSDLACELRHSRMRLDIAQFPTISSAFLPEAVGRYARKLIVDNPGMNLMAKDKQFVPSGVPGLDHVLMGGFIREGFYLIQGDPGSGKTTVALQFVISRIKAG